MSTRPRPPGWAPAKLIHSRTEKVSEDLTWRAARLAPPTPPNRMNILLAEVENALKLTGGYSQVTVQEALQPLLQRLDYNQQYLEYVSLYETYLGHLRRLEKVHQQLSRSSVTMPSGSPLKSAVADDGKDRMTPGFSLEVVSLPPRPKDTSEAAKARRKARRRRQRASRKARDALKKVSEVSSKTALAKAEVGWTIVSRKLTRQQKMAAKGKASATPEVKVQRGPAVPSVTGDNSGPPPPNRKARRAAIYGASSGVAVEDPSAS